jgi:cytochrome c553
MTLIGLTILAVVMTAAVGTASGQGTAVQIPKAAEEKAVNLCSTCHGPRGISTSPEFPILAAQRKGYLVNQLEALRDQKRAEKPAHDFMWGMAGPLDDQMIQGIALYYSSQPLAPGRPGDPAIIAKGRQLFEQGVSERGIPACVACHGADAAGMADFPRLAGQHAKYIVRQVEYIQSLVRAAPVMHGIVKDLTPDEIQAVAVFVQSK